MQFETCAHGNIGITCPQCRGRAVGGAPPVSGFGLPSREPETTTRGHNDATKTLDLGLVIEDAVGRVTRTGNRQAAGAKAFWAQINRPTTVLDHEEQHRTP